MASVDGLSAAGIAAASLFAAFGAGATGLYVHLLRPVEVNGVSRLLILGLLVTLPLLAVKVFLALTLPDEDRLFLSYIFPIAAAPMLIATLLDLGLALMIAGLLAVLASFAGFYMPDARAAAGNSLEGLQMATTFFAASLMGVFAVRGAERINRYLKAGGAVAGSTFIILLSFWFLTPERETVDLLWMVVASALGGLGASVVTVGATVVLGLLFAVTTRVQLMELGQLSHPLLKELQDKASGTFHHSVIVGNLAERAADLTGADSLLVRVGCYFHDIGKIVQPGYYIENQARGENPHDKLAPLTSARVITEHIHNGMELARRHHLPERVRAFIPEHHGTRLVTYFYRKAAAADAGLDPEYYRYPGPKPQSKETAIVMLADSVEAVVRASQDRTPEKMDALVDAVISERVAEGQLNESDLTLSDLRVIAESFKKTLRGVHHPRIEYPRPVEGESQAASRSARGQARARPNGPLDGTDLPLRSDPV